MQKLVAKDFLCLRDVEIEHRGLTLPMGPQGTGKPILAKLLWYFQGLLAFDFVVTRRSTDGLADAFWSRFAWLFSLLGHPAGCEVRHEAHGIETRV